MQHHNIPRSTASLLGLAFFLLTTPLFARGFLPLIEGLPPTEARIVTVHGEIFTGKVEGELQGVHGSFEVDLRTEEGTVLRFTAEDVREIFLPLEGPLLPLIHTAMVLESTTSLEKALRTDYKIIHELDAMHFDAVRWPGRSQHMILQRVNPGFDKAIRVYALRNAKEGVHFFDDLPLFGDEQKLFIAVKNGKSYPIHKWSYRDEFAILFADCPAMSEKVSHRGRKFRHFADHVWAYQQLCATPATTPDVEEASTVKVR
jgi:hypothetical protein